MKCSIIRVATFLTLVACACTSYQEEDAPVGLSINREELSFSQNGESQSVTVTSGTKWDVTSMPSWISLRSISQSGVSPYEWSVNFSVSANDEYNREGMIIIKAGSDAAEISVTQEGKKGKYIAVETVSLSPTELSLTEGENTTLSFTISPSTASVKDVTWTTSASSVATVTQSGRVDAVAEGTALITVTTSDGNKTASCAVTVKAKVIPVTGVSLDKTSLTLTEGDVQELIATVVPSNATDKSVIWTSSNSSVASVSSAGVVTAKTAGSTTITVKTSDGSKMATCAVTVKAKTIAVTGVSLDKTSLTMTVGDTQSLVATVTPSNATDKSVTWSSSNTSVATVSSSGVVTAKAVGSATITVTTNDGGKKATCAVTVQTQAVAVTGVSLNKTSMSLVIGGTEQLTATVTPSNATNKNVSWSSSNTSVATVDSNGNVSAIKVGTAIITVTTEDGGKTATCSVTVNPVAVTGVSLNQTSLTMAVGDTQTLTATVTPSNATDKSVTWSSSNTSVATVSSSGVVTAKAVGSATITVTTNDGGKKATCSVTVKAQTIAVTGVSLNKTSLSMTVGDTQTLTATVTPSNATDKSVTWSSSNTSVATVSSSGVITAKAAGTSTITVTTNDGGKKATCSVTVNAQTVAVTGVSLDRSSITMIEGDTFTLIATVTPSNATDNSVAWSSSNSNVASVSSYGTVFACSVGTATITVTTNDGGKKATCSITVSPISYSAAIPEAIDMGLSVKWASFNLGASKPEEYGDYFAWGETIPYYSSLDPITWREGKEAGYDWPSYKWCEGDEYTLTKYCTQTSFGFNGFTDGKTVLDPEDDAAHVNLGGKWRIPTRTEMDELLNNCTWKWTTQGEIKGYKVTGKNGNSIFLPASGILGARSTYYIGSFGYYLSSSLIDPSSQYDINFGGNYTQENASGRQFGLSVRPVSEIEIIPVSGVSLNITSFTMREGDSQTLAATVTPSNATDKSVTWSSSNTSVATVSSSGVVMAKAAGSATITVTTNDGGKTAMCSVTVQPTLPTLSSVTVSNVKIVTATLYSGIDGDCGSEIRAKGYCYGTSHMPTTNDTCIPVDGDWNVTLSRLVHGTVYYIRSYATTEFGTSYSSEATFTTKEDSNYGDVVDLGLSVKWRTCNIGATKAEEYGSHFAWGEIETKDYCDWTNYKWGSGENRLTKYCSNSSYGSGGFTDYKTTLEPEDDVATVRLGENWRMPTDGELTELRTQCDWVWTTRNGINGYLVTSKVNGNSIFLPAAGSTNGAAKEGIEGDYWSKTKVGGTEEQWRAWRVYFNENEIIRYRSNRSCGRSVRPVYVN